MKHSDVRYWLWLWKYLRGRIGKPKRRVRERCFCGKVITRRLNGEFYKHKCFGPPLANKLFADPTIPVGAQIADAVIKAHYQDPLAGELRVPKIEVDETVADLLRGK